MPTKDELQQDLEIAEVENESLRKQVRTLQDEIDRERGRTKLVEEAATAAGVALAIPTTPAEAEHLELAATRAGIEDDLQAITELHNPPPRDGKAESTLDVVRANNRERAELQTRLAAANAIVSRIAAIVRVSTWDVEGTEIRNAVQRFEHLGFHIARQRTQVARDIANLPKHATTERAELQGWLRAFDWLQEKLELPTTAGPGIALTAPEGLRCTYGDGSDSIVREQSTGMLEVLIVRGDLVERRALVSDLQLNVIGYERRNRPAPAAPGDADAPYR